MTKKTNRTIKMSGGVYNEGDNHGIQVGRDLNFTYGKESPSKKPADYRERASNLGTDLVGIRHILVSQFNETELRDLCFDLDIDYENLIGSSKQDRARELLSLVRRHEMEQRFLQTLRLHRPKLFK